jgi:hypothetical protein
MALNYEEEDEFIRFLSVFACVLSTKKTFVVACSKGDSKAHDSECTMQHQAGKRLKHSTNDLSTDTLKAEN